MKIQTNIVLAGLMSFAVHAEDVDTRSCLPCPTTGVANFCGITAGSLCITGPIQSNTLTVCGTGNTTGCTGLGTPVLSVAGGEFVGGSLGVSGNISACGFINNNGDFRQNDTTILVEDTNSLGNLFVGFGAGDGLANIDGGSKNTIVGNNALSFAVGAIGSENTAMGWEALNFGISTSEGIALGCQALQNLGLGTNNIAIGFQAGINLENGSNNIYIGNTGGGADESNLIRIGASGIQTECFIQGIWNATGISSGSVVVVAANGQLGVTGPTPSSRRFKEDINAMPDQTEKMIQLRPVEFVFKNDATRTQQLGLIAEEVAEVYPNFVVRDKDGQIYTVEYTKLIPILLQQIQLLKQENSMQNEQIQKIIMLLDQLQMH